MDIDLTNLPDDYLLRLQSRLFSLGSCGSITLLNAASSDNSGTTDESISHTASPFILSRYIQVTSSIGGFDPSSPYDLRAVITRPETTSYNNSTAYAQVLPDDFIEFKVVGSLSGQSDKDYYKFKATGSTTISLQAPQRYVQILASNGSVLASGSGSVSYKPFVLPSTTLTYYAVVSVVPRLPVTGSYALTLNH